MGLELSNSPSHIFDSLMDFNIKGNMTKVSKPLIIKRRESSIKDIRNNQAITFIKLLLYVD